MALTLTQTFPIFYPSATEEQHMKLKILADRYRAALIAWHYYNLLKKI